MVSRNAQKLACELIQSHFGDLVGKVCNCLVYKGMLTLPELAKFTELNPSQLKNCLLVLIQHNCVQGFKISSDDGSATGKAPTQYAIFLDTILHRMRFPKFLSTMREEFGEEVEAVFEGLLEHGRLSFDQLKERAKAQSAERKDGPEEAGLEESFRKLVDVHFVERCPVAEPVIPPRSSVDPKKKAPRGATRRIKLDVNFETEEQRIAAAASLPDVERFNFYLPKRNDHHTGAFGKKRKYVTLEEDSRTVMPSDDIEALWRVNYGEFVNRFRQKACVAQARSRLDVSAGTVLDRMFCATRSIATTGKQDTSAPLSQEEITNAVRSSKEGLGMTVDRIRTSLLQMCSPQVGFLSRTGDHSGNYIINIRRIIQVTQTSEVEAIVSNRFGAESRRIFSMLSMNGPMEQSKIAGKALLDARQSLGVLYRLLKDGYLQLQEIARTNDHAPAKTFYLWRVNESALKAQIVDDMYHAALNLVQRLAHELEKEQEVWFFMSSFIPELENEQEVLELLKQLHQQAKSSDGKQPIITLSNRQREQAERIRKIATILETSLLKLDDSILLFDCF